MSMLTKAFVVLVAILSVLLTALVVSFVARTDDLQGQLRASRAQVAVAEDAAVAKENELASAREKASERIKLLQSQVTGLTAQVNDLKKNLDRAEAQALSEQATLAELRASVARLTATGSTNAELLKQVNEELRNRREEAVTSQTKLIERADRIAELEGQLDSLTRQVRSYKEQMQAANEDRQRMETMIAQLPEEVRAQISGAAESAPHAPAVPIAGTVQKVEKIGDATLVQVNVGSRDGVTPNTEFLVHRGESYVGTLLIEQVDTDASVGRMTLATGEIKSGDRVAAGY